MGMTGIAGGIMTAFADMHFPAPVLTQAVACLLAAGSVGAYVGKTVPVTDLP